MTEDELKKKVCPFSFGVHPDNYGPWNCAGSKCAAHRVSHGWSRDKGTGQNGPVELDHYCGLAGRP